MRKRTGSIETSPQMKKRRVKQAAVATVVGASTAAVGVLGYRYGVAQDIFDAQFASHPPVLDPAIKGMITANEAMRTAAPVAMIGAAGLAAYYSISGFTDKRSRGINKLARAEYSGLTAMTTKENEGSGSAYDKSKKRLSKFRKGAGVAALGIAFMSAVSGLEHEVAEGPLRPIKASVELLAPDSKNNTLLLRDDNDTFMTTGIVKREVMDNLVSKAKEKDVEIVPFKKQLFNINGDNTAIEVSLPDHIFEELTGEKIDTNCDNIPVIVNDTTGAEAGDEISIIGTKAQVINVKPGIGQMKRSVAFMADTDMKECLEQGTNDSYFGAIVVGKDLQDTEKFLDEQDVNKSSMVAVGKEAFEDHNRIFWKENAAPALIQTMAFIAIFGSFAAAAERKNRLQQDVHEIALLNAAGISMKDISSVETRRSLHDTFRASVIAIPGMPLAAAALNAVTPGLSVSVGPREWAFAAAVTGGSKIAASRRAVNKFEKNLDLPQAVNG